jgi:predicted aminopeptidase
VIPARQRHVARLLLPLVGLSLTVGGCGQPLYVARLSWTEARILLRREPIERVIARPDVDPALRERLRLVLAARSFARDQLGFTVGDSYSTYAEVTPGETTVHVVQAAYRDRLKPYTWWYPITGRVPYRGFFDRSAAQAEANRLASRDLDVDVRSAVAFSTLGWFADPLLSTTAAEAGPVSLVTTVLHELFHQTLYVAGESTFNESAATFAGERGAIGFFCTGPETDEKRCQRARTAWAETRVRARVLQHLAARLRRLYAEHPPAAERERVRAALTAAAARSLARRGLDNDDLEPPNNARLLGALLYASHLDEFAALAPGDGDPGPGLRALVAAVRGAPDPFESLAALTAERGKLQSG